MGTHKGDRMEKLANRKARPTATRPNVEVKANLPWWKTTGAFAFGGGLLMWAAMPPLAWGWLAWVALVPWVGLIAQEKMAGHKPHRVVWLAGFAFMLANIHWIRLPHPATYLGWLALSFYLSLYIPLFVGISRLGVQQLKWPLELVVPTVWTGLELARGHIMTGFSMGLLSHTQVDWLMLIQLADLTGAYGISFLLALSACCLYRATSLLIQPPLPDRWLAVTGKLAPAALAVATTLGYGAVRLQQEAPLPGIKIGLIQGSVPQTLKSDADKARSLVLRHLELSLQAAQQHPDVIVWPETMWRYGMPVEKNARVRLGEDWTNADVQTASETLRGLGCPLLIGVDTFDLDFTPPKHYNSAALVNSSGKMLGHYHKVHRVLFGEYIPFAESLPWLYRLTPLTGGIKSGSLEQLPIKLNHVRLATNICFESTVPHLIRHQVNSARLQGQPADVLVNLTNDAWFWGSSELDMHLNCAVFRAIECRKPWVAAANNGLSMSIDASGRRLWVSPRQAEAVHVADVKFDNRHSFYLAIGDWFAGLCLLITSICAGWGAYRWRGLGKIPKKNGPRI